MLDGVQRVRTAIGKFCSGGVGIFDGDVVIHMAPPAGFVPGEFQDLSAWYRSSEIHPLICTMQSYIMNLNSYTLLRMETDKPSSRNQKYRKKPDR